MRNLVIALTILSITFALSCKNGSSNSGEDAVASSESKPDGFTYAEISVKKDGEWQDGVYKGGNFKNIDSLNVPEKHSDHSGYIRYEGPGWENKNIAYRLYLDWRNGIDIFGKRVDTLVLPYVGGESLGSYHDDLPWGMDILKAGGSLGIGGFARFVNDSLYHFENVGQTIAKVSNNDQFSEVDIQYNNWETSNETTNLKANLKIFPNDLFTRVQLTSPLSISGICTGMVRNDSISTFRNEDFQNSNWTYIASYDKQSLSGENDELGLALFFRKNDMAKIFEHKNDHLIVFKNRDSITYYFLAAWDQQPDGFKTKAEFKDYLDSVLERLNSGKLN